MSRQNIFEKISKERDRQDEVYAEDNDKLDITDYKFIALLASQLGQCASAIQSANIQPDTEDNLKDNLMYGAGEQMVQIAALAVLWLEKAENKVNQ